MVAGVLRSALLALALIVVAANRINIDRTEIFQCTDQRLLSLGGSPYLTSPALTWTQFQCIDWSGGLPIFVRGTYGMFGYFEGPIDNTMTGRYNWYESSTPNTTDMGTANVTHVPFGTGFSASGASKSSLRNARWIWNATNCTNMTSVFRMDDMMRLCLWSPVTNRSLVKSTLGHNKSSLDGSRFDSGPGMNNWCFSNYSAGSYRYNYSMDECRSLPCATQGTIEEGSYQKVRENLGQALDVMLTDTYAYFGSWKAETGPAKGSLGPDLYAAIFDNNMNLSLRGMYCFWNQTTMTRTDCFFELYSFVPALAHCKVFGVCRNQGDQVCCTRELGDPTKMWSIDFGKTVSIASVTTWRVGPNGEQLLPVASQQQLQGLQVVTGYNKTINQPCNVPEIFSNGPLLDLSPQMQSMTPGYFAVGFDISCAQQGRYFSVVTPNINMGSVMASGDVQVQVCVLPKVVSNWNRQIAFWLSQSNMTSNVTVLLKHSGIRPGYYAMSPSKTSELNNISIDLYVGGVCDQYAACTGQFRSHLQWSGHATADNSSWEADIILPGGLIPGTYWLRFSSYYFYSSAFQWSYPAQAPLHAAMVARVQSGYRVVLTWGMMPLDLDLHVMTIVPPGSVTNTGWSTQSVPDASHVYWDNNLGPKFGGVSLDVDTTIGYGPETVTFTNETDATNTSFEYHIAVDVYNSDEPEVFGDGLAYVRVNIYDSSGIIYYGIPSASVAQALAWYVGTVFRSESGQFSFVESNTAITPFSGGGGASGGGISTFWIAFRDSQIQEGQYSESQDTQDLYTIDIGFFNGSTACTVEGICTGSVQWLEKEGAVSADDNSWNATVISPGPSADGWLRFTSELFYSMAVRWSYASGGFMTTVISRSCRGCVRVVLTWPGSLGDLDLHIMDVPPPSDVTNTGWSTDVLPDYEHVYWNSRGPKWNGVQLDVDSMDGGPETVTFGADSDSSRDYFIVTHVFNDNNVENFDAAASGVMVRIYNYSGLIYSFNGNASIIGNTNVWEIGILTRSTTSGWGWSFNSFANGPPPDFKTVTIAFSDSQISQALFSDANYGYLDSIDVTLYSGGRCSQTGICNGTSSSLEPTSGGSVVDSQWEVTEVLPLTVMDNHMYWLVFSSSSYYTTAVSFTLPTDTIHLTMVQKVCAQCLRVVLTWGASPADEDLHVLNIQPPTDDVGWLNVDSTHEVDWQDGKLGPAFGGVQLDTDNTQGYGPETVSFGPDVVNGTYYIAVHGFSANFGDGYANTKITIYNGNGIIAQGQPDSQAENAWGWQMGKVTAASGVYTFTADVAYFPPPQNNTR